MEYGNLGCTKYRGVNGSGGSLQGKKVSLKSRKVLALKFKIKIIISSSARIDLFLLTFFSASFLGISLEGYC